MKKKGVVYIPNSGPGCGCHEPARARELAESMSPKPFVVSEESSPRKVRGVEPIVLAGGPGSKCRPFLKVVKDDVKFAACNALSEEIGPLDTPKKAFRVLQDAIGDENVEVFGIITLDLHLRMKSIAETGRGEAASVQAPMVPTLQAALIDGAHGVILFHLHPSGVKAEPSDADKATTKDFVKAFETCGVAFIDHLIYAGDHKKKSYFSFAEAGLL